MSNELRSIYEKAMADCSSNYNAVQFDAGCLPTQPLLICPPSDYYRSAIRIMFFGQETNGWGKPYKESLGLDHLLSIYDEFANHGGGFKYRGQFWNALRSYLETIKAHNSSTSFIYNNLVKIGMMKVGTPCKSILDWQHPWIEVIREEIKILKPNVIICFSGPRYDINLKRIFPDLTLLPVDGFKQRQLSRLMDLPNSPLAFRTYHPRYLYMHDFDRIKHSICGVIRSELSFG